jgi:hypothetical protein
VIKKKKAKGIVDFDLCLVPHPSRLFKPFYFIIQKNFAVSAKLVRLTVNIKLGAAIMHDADVLPAMAEIESMSQFMNRFFYDPF